MVRFPIFVGILLLGCHSSSPQAVLKTFTLEELIPFRGEFAPDRHTGDWISDKEFVHRDPGQGIIKYDASTKTQSTLVDENELYKLSGYSVSKFSKDLKYLLLTSEEKKVYRYSRLAVYSVYDLENKSTQNISKGDLQVVAWGHGHSLAYVQNNNVYYVPDAARPDDVTPLTTEGKLGEVYFGVADWIYEEEVLNAAEALWFSPEGTYLAVASFNDTKVESASYPIYGNPFDMNNQYPEMVRFKYPKAGRVNPAVGLQVFKLGDPSSEAKSIPAPVDVVGLDHILGRVAWASDHNLIILWLNRRQNIGLLVNCDLINSKCNMLQEQSEPSGWIDITQPYFDSTGTKMLDIQPQYSDDRRFPHATIYDFNTLETKDLSPGNVTVTEILGWNEEKNVVYYVAAPESLPWQRHLWSSTVSGDEVRCVSCKQSSCHVVDPDFSPGARFGVLSCSSSNVPPKIFLYSAQTDEFVLLKDNLRLNEKLSKYKLPMTLFNKIHLEDDLTANIKLLLPPVIEKGQQYPMVVRVYAGPGTARVLDNFDLEYYNMYLSANRSFISASIDVRGSKVMGVDNLFAVNNALGTVEITDTLAAIRRLEELYQFIDRRRVGVWGWSYGGFATTMMLARDDQHLLACGAAVAPVTSWLYYDSIYTERYMDTPQVNREGYLNSDLMSLSETLRGRKYLLVHGSGDDNVHYQHSLQLAKILQHSDIAFEQVSYTDENHSLRGVSRHFYHTLDRFWTHCFDS